MGLRRTTVLLVVALLAGGATAMFALRSSGPVPLPHPRQAIRSTYAAVHRQKSVRWTETGWSSQDDTTFAVGRHWRSKSDVTADSGVQHVTIYYGWAEGNGWTAKGPTGVTGPHGPRATVRVEIRRVGNLFYVKGNERALEWLPLGLNHAQASRYAWRWISVPKQHDLFQRRDWHQPVAEQLTLAELGVNRANRYDKVAPTATKNPNGTQVVNFDGEGSNGYSSSYSSMNLVARADGEPLPVTVNKEDVDRRLWSTSSSGQFSRWNEPVHVLAPAHAVPLATVRRS